MEALTPHRAAVRSIGILITVFVLSLPLSCAKQPSLEFENVHGPLPHIESIEHSAYGGAYPGDSVEFTLTGDPGFVASASLPGLASQVSMAEVTDARGLYRGTLILPSPGEPGRFDLLGRLGTGDRVAVLQGPPLEVKRIVDVPRDEDAISTDELNRRKVLRPVYFDFDTAELRSDAVQALEENLIHLRRYSIYKILIEGHCDERGTNEYNMILGDRRAHAVRSYLRNAGIFELHLRTISYGEERPADTGHSEEAWARNRRVEFVWED